MKGNWQGWPLLAVQILGLGAGGVVVGLWSVVCVSTAGSVFVTASFVVEVELCTNVVVVLIMILEVVVVDVVEERKLVKEFVVDV